MPRRFTSRSADACGLPLRTELADSWFAGWCDGVLADLRRASHAGGRGAGMVPNNAESAGVRPPGALHHTNP